jgi:hypothetical protein
MVPVEATARLRAQHDLQLRQAILGIARAYASTPDVLYGAYNSFASVVAKTPRIPVYRKKGSWLDDFTRLLPRRARLRHLVYGARADRPTSGVIRHPLLHDPQPRAERYESPPLRVQP